MARKRTRPKPQFGVGRNGKKMSPAQLRAIRKAQAASARKRKGTGRPKTKGRKKRGFAAHVKRNKKKYIAAGVGVLAVRRFGIPVVKRKKR